MKLTIPILLLLCHSAYSQRRVESYSVYEDDHHVGPRGSVAGGRTFSESTWSSHSSHHPHRPNGYHESSGESYGHSYKESFHTRGGHRGSYGSHHPPSGHHNYGSHGPAAFGGAHHRGIQNHHPLGQYGHSVHQSRHNVLNGHNRHNPSFNRHHDGYGPRNDYGPHRGHGSAHGHGFGGGYVNEASHGLRSIDHGRGALSRHGGYRHHQPNKHATGREHAYGVEKVIDGPNTFGHHKEVGYVMSYGSKTGHGGLVDNLKNTFNDLLKDFRR